MSRYPTIEAQRTFIAAYLGADATDDAVTALRAETERQALASHLKWGIWGLLNALISNVSFDYVGCVQFCLHFFN